MNNINYNYFVLDNSSWILPLSLGREEEYLK